MKFKNGEESEIECKQCQTKMIYEMSFKDQFSYTSGHYTTDLPLLVCPKCDYNEDYEVGELENER